MNRRALTSVALAAMMLACLGAATASASASGPAGVQIGTVKVGGKQAPLRIATQAGRRAELALKVNGSRAGDPFRFAQDGIRVAGLSAKDGLRPGRNVLAVTLIRANGLRATKRTSVRVPRRALLADAGHDIDVSVAAPEAVGIAPPAGNGESLRFRWRLRDAPQGAGIELGSPQRSRTTVAAEAPGLYELRLTARKKGRPVSRDTVTVAVSPADPPIGAKISTYDDRRGITLRGVSYGGGREESEIAWALVSRATGTVVDSGRVKNNADGIADLRKTATDHSSDRDSLQYMMVFSGAGGVPSGLLGDFSALVKQVGGSRLERADFDRLAAGGRFSVLGIPGAPPGAATVFIPAEKNRIGVLYGYLRKSAAINQAGVHLYDYVPDEQVTIDTRAEGSDEHNNTIMIGTRPSRAFTPDEITGAFNVLVLTSESLHETDELLLEVNGPGGDRERQARAAAELKRAIDAAPGDPLLVAQTMGKPKAAGPEWSDLIKQFERAGANPHLLNALNGTTEYSLIGLVGSDAPASEASTAHDTGPSSGPARLVGTVSRDRRYRFQPTVTGNPGTGAPTSVYNTELASLVYQPATDFPPFNAEAAAAAKYICETLELCQGSSSCTDMRSCYWQDYEAAWGILYTTLGTITYPGDGRGFGADAFAAVKAQLQKEFAAVATVQDYLQRLMRPYEKSSQRAYVDLQSIGDEVYQSVQRPADTDNSVSWGLGFASKLVLIGTFEGPPVSAAASGISAVLGLASYLSAKQGPPILGTEIKVRANALASEYMDRLDLVRRQTDDIGRILVSDYGKLTTANTKIKGPWRLPSDSDAVDLLREGTRQWFYETLVPVAYPYLITGNQLNARSFSCDPSWSTQPDSAQMQATVGYAPDGNPIRRIFFFARGLGPSYTPPASLGEKMFNPPTARNPGLGIEKLSFFVPQNFGGAPLHAVSGTPRCSVGWIPHD